MPEKSNADKSSVAKGLGLAAGFAFVGVLIFLGSLFFDLGPVGRIAVYSTAIILSALGFVGACVELDKLTSRESFGYFGVGIGLLGLVVVLLIIRVLGDVAGFWGAVVVIAMIVLGCLAIPSVFMGLGRFLHESSEIKAAWTVAPSKGKKGRVKQQQRKKGLDTYQRLSLTVAALSPILTAAATVIAALLKK